MKEIVHIGFPKTASTTLQEHVFAKLLEVANVGRPFTDPETAEILNGLALGDDSDYPENKLAARIATGRASDARALIYSDE